MIERDIKLRLGTRNRNDSAMVTLPMQAIDGTPADGGMNRRGLGRYWFVVLPHSGYIPTDEELAPFLAHIDKQGIPDNANKPDVPKRNVVTKQVDIDALKDNDSK